MPEVSRILEAHMDAAEQRWRTGEFVPSTQTTEYNADENETTLTPSHNTTLEDTLTEQNADKVASVADDSGLGNDSATFNESDAKGDESQSKKPNNDTGNAIKRSGMGNASTPLCKQKLPPGKNIKDLVASDDVDDPKNLESVLSDDVDNFVTDISTDEVFEDCVEDISNNEASNHEDNAKKEDVFDRLEENYSIEMKLALGLEDAK